MTKITVQPDCGNSPKIEFLKKINIAFAQGDADFLLERVTDQISWEIIGDKKIEGKEQFARELEAMNATAPTELILDQVLTHGKLGAANGSIKMPDGSEYAFSDFYEFRGTKLRKITSYVLKIRPEK